MKFCLQSGHCQFEGKIYKQKNGLAIGSSLSPIVAEIVLYKLFSDSGAVFSNDVIKFKIKYVDDGFFILLQDSLEDVFHYLNNFHSRLKFTRETRHTELNFLDITILRSR